MEALKLLGILVVIVGLVLKLDTLATVIGAGILTGLIAGMTPLDILSTLGDAFIKNRVATLFVLTLPAIGICERYGLKDKAVDFIKGLKVATTGRIIFLYMLIRSFAAAFSLRVGGHPQFVRPLINPMAQGAALANYGKIDEKSEDEIKGLCAGSENFGNFFAQNCFMGSSGTLLIVTTLTEQGIAVDALGIARWSIPIAVISAVVACIYFIIYDRKLDKQYKAGKAGK